MYKNKFKPLIFAAVVVSFFIFGGTKYVFASPQIISATLNGNSQNATFNPSAGESVSIQVIASVPVKFTRFYICSVSQICNGTSGNYTKYFTQTDILDTITKSWDGKNSAGTVVPEGEYKIMALMLETGASASVSEFAPYSIILSLSSQSSTTTNSGTTTTTTSQTSTTETVNRTVNISTHSDEEDLSDYNDNQIFEASAGRQRIAYVGTPMEFKANYKMPKSMESNLRIFKWSLGDGFEASGEKITHTYKYPGEYNIILNGESGDKHAVSRTLVKVLTPNISLNILPNGDMEILNKGNTEINLGFWKLKSLSKEFIFPKDTIIGAGKKIILSKDDTKIQTDNNRISLNNPSDGEIFATNNGNNPVLLSEESSGITIEKAEALYAEYKKLLALKSVQSASSERQFISTTSREEQSPKKADLSQTATVIESMSATSTSGFLGKLWRGSMLRIKSVARLFYDF